MNPDSGKLQDSDSGKLCRSTVIVDSFSVKCLLFYKCDCIVIYYKGLFSFYLKYLMNAKHVYMFIKTSTVNKFSQLKQQFFLNLQYYTFFVQRSKRAESHFCETLKDNIKSILLNVNQFCITKSIYQLHKLFCFFGHFLRFDPCNFEIRICIIFKRIRIEL